MIFLLIKRSQNDNLNHRQSHALSNLFNYTKKSCVTLLITRKSVHNFKIIILFNSLAIKSFLIVTLIFFPKLFCSFLLNTIFSNDKYH